MKNICKAHAFIHWLRPDGLLHIECTDCMQDYLPEWMVIDRCYIVLRNGICFKSKHIKSIVIDNISNLTVNFVFSSSPSHACAVPIMLNHQKIDRITLSDDFHFEEKEDGEFLMNVRLSSIICAYKEKFFAPGEDSQKIFYVAKHIKSDFV